jgi:hypothetical protein
MIALDGDLGDFAFLDGSKELTVSSLQAGSLRLVKHIEKKNHHQADYQPESQIFIKWTQLESPPDQQFQWAVGPPADLATAFSGGRKV